MRRGGIQELAPVGPSVQALVAHSALRRAGNHHAVADLDALHQRPDGFHHAHAGMIGDRRLLDRSRRQRPADDGVANRRRLRANQDFARLDREQLELLDRRARAVPDKSLELAPGLGARELRGSLSGDDLRGQRHPAGSRRGSRFSIFRRESAMEESSWRRISPIQPVYAIFAMNSPAGIVHPK